MIQTQDAIWQTRLNALLATTTSVFFPNGIMKEVACEDNGKCDLDQQSFKAYLSRWMGHTTKLAPFTAATINPMLQASAKAALNTCTGGTDGNQCGLTWNQTFDGNVGVGEQLAAMEVLQSLLQPYVSGPVTANTGGNSTGNVAAGGGDTKAVTFNTITGGDKAGAGIITTIALLATFGGAYWMGL
jgi:mannan endo-1,6-alpha-mannosidase